MFSLTKVQLSDQQLDTLVKSALGSTSSIDSSIELTEGWFNTAYDLKLTDGRSTILKVAPPSTLDMLSIEKNIMRTEVEALRIVREAGGIPVPEVYAYDPSLELIDSEYFFMEKVEGSPYVNIKDKLTAEEREAIEQELGQYNRLINEIEGKAFGKLNEESHRTASWAQIFGLMMNDLLADGKRLGAQLPAEYEEIEARVEERIYTLNEVKKPCLVHLDLWDGNVFVKDNRITAITDWERARWGDPLIEFYFRTLANSEAYHKGYGALADSPDIQKRKSLYDLFLDLILVIECYSRKFDEQDHIKWAHDNLIQGWARFKSIDLATS